MKKGNLDGQFLAGQNLLLNQLSERLKKEPLKVVGQSHRLRKTHPHCTG